jgi:type I restriction enzyme, S subunit
VIESRRLGELFLVEKGRIGIRAATPGPFLLVTTGENHQTHVEPHYSGDAVCIPMVSATGHGHASIKRLHHINGEFAVGSILCACIAKDERVSARYVYYWLTARKNDVLIPLMQGSANVSLKLADIAGIEVSLPPLLEQQAIVARLDALADKARQLTAHLDAIEADADRLLAQQFRDAIADAPYRPMAEISPLVRREVLIDPDASYTELGVRSFYKGTFHRRTLPGVEFTWQKMYRIESGDLIFSNIMAWEQAIALAKPEDHGCVGNHRMLSCLADKKRVLPGFLAYYFTTEEGFATVYAASPGTAARNRTLVAGNLEAIQVPVPSLATQQVFVDLQATVSALKTRHAAIRESNAALLPATLERLFVADDRSP